MFCKICGKFILLQKIKSGNGVQEYTIIFVENMLKFPLKYVVCNVFEFYW